MSSSSAPPPVRLAILETDIPIPSIVAKYGGYGGVFEDLFDRAGLKQQLHLSMYDVTHDGASYPDPKDIDAILITGSKASAYEDKAWINRLVQYTQDLLDGDDVKKVIGVCFGHQIVGRALGAKVAVSPHGWEISVTDVELTEKGKEVFGLETMVSYMPLLPSPPFSSVFLRRHIPYAYACSYPAMLHPACMV